MIIYNVVLIIKSTHSQLNGPWLPSQVDVKKNYGQSNFF